MGRWHPRWKWAAVLVILGALLLAPGVGTTLAGSDGTPGVVERQRLDVGRWYAPNQAAINTLIARYWTSVPFPELRQYAVFDWDDTSVVNDTGLTMFVYMLDHQPFRYTTKRFEELVKLNVDQQATTVTNDNQQQVPLEAVIHDLIRDYRLLYEMYTDKVQPLEGLVKTDLFRDFKVKMLVMYGAPSIKGRPWWSLNFVADMTKEELQALARASHEYNLGAGLSTVSLTSLAGEAGVFTRTYRTGMRVVPEIANLMHTLDANGIDVYVVSGGLQDEVVVLATEAEFGYNLPPDHVIGVSLATTTAPDGRTVYKPELTADTVVTVNEGKVVTIKQSISPKHKGNDPILVCGDSDGDYAMMTSFPNTVQVLLTNRGHNGWQVNQWCDKDPTGKCLLQGRNETTGLWQPGRITIPLPNTINPMFF